MPDGRLAAQSGTRPFSSRISGPARDLVRKFLRCQPATAQPRRATNLLRSSQWQCSNLLWARQCGQLQKSSTEGFDDPVINGALSNGALSVTALAHAAQRQAARNFL